MKNVVYIIIVFLLATGCKNKSEDQAPMPDFVPTDVLVKTKKDFTIDKVFDFINQYDHSVEYIYGSFYTSSLAPDSLQYVLNYVNAKSYTRRPDWPVYGYNHYLTNVIHIFPRLYDIKNKNNQQDWLESLRYLKLKEVTDRDDFNGSIIFFHVPAGTEKEWLAKFKAMPFVDWAELNGYLQIEL
jgi:hypothetical protein